MSGLLCFSHTRRFGRRLLTLLMLKAAIFMRVRRRAPHPLEAYRLLRAGEPSASGRCRTLASSQGASKHFCPSAEVVDYEQRCNHRLIKGATQP